MIQGRAADRRAIGGAICAAVLLHAGALIASMAWPATPDGRQAIVPRLFYTRLLPMSESQSLPTPQPAPTPARVAYAGEQDASTAARTRLPSKLTAAVAKSTVNAPGSPVSLAQESPAPALAASADTPLSTDTSAAPAASGSSATPPPSYLQAWPSDTRLTYVTNSGPMSDDANVRARILWQRSFAAGQARYQTTVQLAGNGQQPSMQLTSQGQINAEGLAPEMYAQLRDGQQQIVSNHDSAGEGGEFDQPANAQDLASQFMELAHRFASGQARPEPGGDVSLRMTGAAGVDDRVYDIMGMEALDLPRIGVMRSVHLAPRRNEHNAELLAEVWLAPSLRYLPVRIRLAEGGNTLADLLLTRVEQR